jgi:heme A synthase
MWYGLLADGIVVIHVAYVSFVIIGLLLIVLGGILGWKWVRNPWFRAIHFLAIAFVAFEAIIGMTCPLTDWEHDLRVLANQPADERTFIGRFMDDILFYQGPDWVFTASYIGFAALVLLTLLLVPPRWRKPDRHEPLTLRRSDSPLQATR